MVPYSYNMVDMGGIDLAEANGTVVSGVYERIVEAMNLCGDVILYNWKFAGIDIAPSAYAILQQTHSILINGLIQVTELDQITVIGLPPPPVPVAPLDVVENGLYEAELPASGFNPVRVTVPSPPLVDGSAVENGEFYPTEGAYGFRKFSVSVPTEVAFNPIVGSVYVSASSQFDVAHSALMGVGYKNENFWGGSTAADQFIVFEFFEQVALSKVKFAPALQQGQSHWFSETVILQASNDGTSYVDIDTFSDLVDNNNQVEFSISTSPYKYYKFVCKKSTTAAFYPGLGKIQLYI